MVRKTLKAKSSGGVLPVRLHSEQGDAFKVRRGGGGGKKYKASQFVTKWSVTKIVLHPDPVLIEFGISHHHPYTCGCPRSKEKTPCIRPLNPPPNHYNCKLQLPRATVPEISSLPRRASEATNMKSYHSLKHRQSQQPFLTTPSLRIY